MKQLVAVAAVGVALAAIPVSTRTGVGVDQALAQSGPCYKGETVGACPTARTARTALPARRTVMRSRMASQR
jgi:hypothetical protein